MAILFDWYEDPKPSNKQQGENGNTLHPRIKIQRFHRDRRTAPTYSRTLFTDRNRRHSRT